MISVAALAGNPNCGKTTLFNALTGSHQYVGNWPGVTVEKREAVFALNDTTVTLTDLPGAYSLSPYSLEEQVTRDYLLSGQAGAVINIVDAMNLERGLFFTIQLLQLDMPVILAINMADDLITEGGRIDTACLSEILACPVVLLSARRKTGFDELFAHLYRALTTPFTKRAKTAFESDEEIFAHIGRVLRQADYQKRAPGKKDVTARIDRVLTGRYTAFPILFCVMLFMFFMAFGAPGVYLTGMIERAVLLVNGALSRALAPLPDWARSLALDGALAGAGGVLCFLPQILILFLCMAIAEDSGYMARAAYITDRFLRKLGLSGRSVIPMLMGLGCTTTAVAAARGVENERDRRMTVMLTPCMSCGAKLPVYALIARVFFPDQAALVILSLYILGAFVMAIMGTVLRRRVFKDGDTPFLMELPAYRLPVLNATARRLRQRAGDFIRRAGTVIVLMSAVAWFFRYFSPELTFAVSMDQSMLARAGESLAPLFRPMGFGSWQAVCGLFSGLVAKEGVLSTLQVLYRAGDMNALALALPQGFSGSAGAYAYMVFVLLYPPCASAVAAIRRELNDRRLLFIMLGMQTLFAVAFSLLAYQVGQWLG